jgi:Putative peptidoglycan binding domain
MKIFVCICLSLVLTSPQFALAGKQKSGGGGNAAHASAAGHAGSLGGGGAARFGGAGQHNFHSDSVHNGGQIAHTQHGLSAQHSLSGQHGLSTQHGLNSHHQMAGHGLNAHNAGFQNHAGKFSGNHFVGNRFAARNHLAGHWRSGLHWRNCHALYAGYHRVWHDRWWWRGHYSDVVFVGGPYWGGSWYWDGGYWFPAWGYDPGYVGYVYDGPIFAYDNLPPDEVVVNVQEALQDQGYYSGNIDGQFGEQTRDALAAYQRDHSLDVTAAIDEPTVQSLGLGTEAA